MGQWLDRREHTVYVIAEDGNRYAFQARKSFEGSGYVSVKCPDGKRRSVTGDKIGDRFKTNPWGKNALAILTPEQIEKAKGTESRAEPPANELSPVHTREPTLEEIRAMSPEELEEYKKLLDRKLGI